ncbi:hypothetical protein M404DRAFT_25949 [Pisolithus tinctorius Marx 270]|uniref:Uncharacterized protein n=1 Tax=Pisolithus tinctorius Marx 270 TaxID=870435 RepID=A0A0C3NVJ6_PISTI|nr:hypothetical protein M404DRAFT_25949 [Pisolithus tinctorius Marx 270]
MSTTPLVCDNASHTNDPTTTVTNVPLVVYPGNKGVLKAAQHKYDKDPFFKQIIDELQAFKNFEIMPDGFISLKLPDRTVLHVMPMHADED